MHDTCLRHLSATATLPIAKVLKPHVTTKHLPHFLAVFPHVHSKSPCSFMPNPSVQRWIVAYLCSVKTTKYQYIKQHTTMKRTMFLTTVMIMSMLLTSVNANAQRRGHEREREHTEYRDSRELRGDRRIPGRDKHYDRRPQSGGHDRYGHAPRPQHRPQVLPHGCKMVRCAPPSVRRGCYVPGWEGRVRYHGDGRWGYCVGGVWTYFDCYYNPYDFFCEPMPPRPMHHAPVVHVHHTTPGEVAAGVVAGTVIGCIIGAMAH